MKYFLKISLLAFLLVACSEKETDKYPSKQADWKDKQVEIKNFDNYTQGQTYLPVYSHIYHIQEDRTFDLTITASIRNVSNTDSVFISKADYYNTEGENIRQYVENPIYLSPLETLEIVISEKDFEGGSGANFLFDWATSNENTPPLFEAVMISTYSQVGFSFTTRGVQVSQ